MTRAQELAQSISSKDYWKDEELAELCDLAGMLKEYEEADGETFEDVVYAAAKKLNVEI